MQLHDVHKGIHKQQEAKTDRPWRGLGSRQDLGQGPQGPFQSPGVQDQPDLRGRPDAARPPRAQARVRQRSVQEELRRRQPEGDLRSVFRPARSWTRKPFAPGSGQGPGARRHQDPGHGALSKPLEVHATKFSASAASKIAAAGGKTVVVPYRPHAVSGRPEKTAPAAP